MVSLDIGLEAVGLYTFMRMHPGFVTLGQYIEARAFPVNAVVYSTALTLAPRGGRGMFSR